MAMGVVEMRRLGFRIRAKVALMSFLLILHGCGDNGVPLISPDEIRDITIHEWYAHQGEPLGASDLSAVSHVALGPGRTRQVFRDAEFRASAPLWKSATLGVARLEAGGECRLWLSEAPWGWLKILGQRGYYVLTAESREELRRLMEICSVRCFRPAWDRARRMTKDDGPHPMRVGGKYGYVAESGVVDIPPQFDDAMPFSEGLAAVRVGDAESGRWGYINRDGTFAIEPRFAGASFFSDGLAAITVDDYFDGKQGYVDRDGKVVVEARFQRTREFRCGLARAMVGQTWHHIDRGGRTVTLESVSDFNRQEGVRVVRVNGKYGFRGGHGFMVVPPEFEDATMFSEGLAAVKKGGKWGYVNKAGEMVIDPRFDRAEAFSGGRAEVQIGPSTLLIDRGGNEVLPETQNGGQ